MAKFGNRFAWVFGPKTNGSPTRQRRPELRVSVDNGGRYLLIKAFSQLSRWAKFVRVGSSVDGSLTQGIMLCKTNTTILPGLSSEESKRVHIRLHHPKSNSWFSCRSAALQIPLVAEFERLSIKSVGKKGPHKAKSFNVFRVPNTKSEFVIDISKPIKK